MSNSWFTSDLHLGHYKLIRELRQDIIPPDSSDLSDHDSILLDRIFEVVKSGDNFYCLGDIFWKANTEKKTEIFNEFQKRRINFHWILGNHDKPFKHTAVKSIQQIKDIKIDGQAITLCHYPLMVWKNSHYGSWQLYGHEHRNNKMGKVVSVEETRKIGKQMNVNVEFHNYYPWSFEEIVEVMQSKNDNVDLINDKEEEE